jgi:pimeloyl-ACP methyl ester carboxylesterase
VASETDVRLSDGRTVHVYDSGIPDADATVVVFWHHGTPQIGEPPEPLIEAGHQHGIRWVGYDRPGYGGSPRRLGRAIGSAVGDVAAIADALGIDRFVVMGHSGGSPHALACAALLPDRVVSVVCLAGLAPFDAVGLDWFAGMAPSGAAELHAAVASQAALEARLASTVFDEEQFTPTDHAALASVWSCLGVSAERATRHGPAGMVDDDLAYVRPWGFDLDQVRAPVLYVHGDADRIVPSSHARWLGRHSRSSELWLRPDDGHISVLNSYVDALNWLAPTTAAS